MPNLDYNPKDPRDLMGEPIAIGDIVAWGTTAGRSAALTVCQIVKIRFTKKVNSRNKECPQGMAEEYTLLLRPIYGTGYISDDEYVREGIFDAFGQPEYYTNPDGTLRLDSRGKAMQKKHRKLPWESIKPLRVTLVRNVIKLNYTLEEVLDVRAR